MKKKYLPWFAAAALIVILLGMFAYFHVDGREIGCIDGISDAYTATATKYNGLNGQETELTLNGEQILRLKSLIQESSFSRQLYTNRTYSGPDVAYRYGIVLELYDEEGKQQDFLHLSCIGNQVLSLDAPYRNTSLHLKINNPQWQASLDAILADT